MFLGEGIVLSAVPRLQSAMRRRRRRRKEEEEEEEEVEVELPVARPSACTVYCILYSTVLPCTVEYSMWCIVSV